MKVNTPRMKGFDAHSFDKNSEQVQSTENPDTAELVKQPFPVRQFLLACLCLIGGALLFWILSTFAILNPDPLKQEGKGFDIMSFNYLIEQNAPLRLPVINSVAKISNVGSSSNDLALRFEDDREVLLMKELESTNPSYSISSLDSDGSAYSSRQIILEFNIDKISLDSQQTEQLDDILLRINNSADGTEYNLTVYAFSNQSGFEDQPAQSSFDEATSSLIQPIKRPFYAASTIVKYLGALQDSIPDSMLNVLLNTTVSEPKKQLPLEDKTPELEQNVAPAINPNDYTRVSNTLLLQKAQSVSNYLRSGLQSNTLNVQINTENIVRSNINVGVDAGVIIDISNSVQSIEWSGLIDNTENVEITINAESNEKFQIVNNDTINIVHADSSIETIAILPSALSRYYDEKVNYSALSPKSYPSALSLLALFSGIFGALYILAYRQESPDADIVKKQLLVDSFVSDAPASNLSQDRLGFAEISTALSRFLRNAGTKAPLTLAITGAWGSGKSSLMHFLKENLLQFHMHPVWVNAWHHQNEEQFLAGLLSAVRRHAIPPFWTSAGLLYRWNLLKMRWHEAPLFYYSFAFLFLASLTFILTANTSLPTSASLVSITSLPFLSALIAAIPIVNAGMDKISRLSRASIVQTLLKGGKQGLDLRANVGLREKFATEFGMLCNALGDSTLTIFIDDLDRCKEARIMDVMETINYLVCSGDCFIVIAMERDPVEKAIEAYYKSTYTELDSTKLKLKARRYLEKIINIEIPVPNANEEQFNALVKVKDFQHKQSKLKWLKKFAVVASLLVSIVLGYLLSSVIELPQREVSDGEVVPIVKPSDPDQIDTGESERGVVDNKEPTKQEISELTIAQKSGENRSEFIIIPFLLMVAIGMLIRAERYRQRKRIVETDSEPFLVAISIWARVMGMSQKTPRSIKRFVNRTRFLAMRNAESETNIKEENLVTLAALIDIAKDKGLSNLENIEEHLPPINNAELAHQVSVLVQKCHAINEEKRAQLQRWIRGFNVS